MKAGKVFLIHLGVFLFIAGVSAAYTDEIGNQLNASRQAYAAGLYQSSLRNGLGAMDLIYQKQALKLATLIPAPAGYICFQSNISYSFSDQNGIMDYSVQVETSFSNESNVIRIDADTSLNNVERFVNLIRSFDYLSDKADYKKFTLKQKKSEWTYITEKSDAYFIPVLIETNETVTSGLLLKINISNLTKMKNAEKDKLMEAGMKEILEKINYRELSVLVK